MGDWQPIESAPMDGTDILLWSAVGTRGEYGPTVGHWMTEEECRVDTGDCGGECHCREYEHVDPYWLSWDGGFSAEYPPTHWQALPTTPSPIEESRRAA